MYIEHDSQILNLCTSNNTTGGDTIHSRPLAPNNILTEDLDLS